MTSSLTPPGKTAHGLSYSAIGELTQYTPPLASATAPPGQCAAGAECYQYNVDRQLEDVTLGD